jgi:Gpi18-like mannosyltransferase/outer membrane protein assembly factor BamB
VLALGLALRFIIAYVILPGSGFRTDVISFQAWAGRLASEGPGTLYQSGFIDYTPGYMYVLWLIGIVGRAIGGIGDLIKLPPILADAAIGYLAWSMTRELGARQGVALLAAMLFVLNPISWFDSAIWGQVDSFGVVFMLLALRELWRDHPERAAILTVIAAVIKPQLGILIPIVAVVTIRRALWPAGAYGDDPAPDPVEPRPGRLGRFLAWERETGRPMRILTTALAGFVVAVILCAPFGLSVLEPSTHAPFVRSGLLQQVGRAAAGYPYVTVNAYNPWALVPGDTGLTLAKNGLWMCDMTGITPNLRGGERCSAGTAFIGPFPALVVGTALLLATIGIVLVYAARNPDRRTLLVALAVLALAFFVVPTRVHERYVYPFYALGAILAAVSLRWRVAYVLLSAATFANMYVVITTIYDNSSLKIRDWLGIGSSINDEVWVAVIAMVHLLGFVWVLAQLRADGRERLADEIAEAGVVDALPPEPEEPPPVGALAPGGATIERSPAAAAYAASAALEHTPPHESGPPPDLPPVWGPVSLLGDTAFGQWLGERFGGRPSIPDRSAALAHERGGRFDKLDVWLLVVLVVATLVLRMFRLGEPLSMHFDEVYHARTATEFLQDWRYGDESNIYEWTHPHLGKYIIAGGIVALGDDRVSATSSVGEPVNDALVEPTHTDLDTGDETGSRLWLATDTGIRAYDLGSREMVASYDIGPTTALAHDPTTSQLFAATEDGQVLALDLTGLDIEGAESVDPYFVAELGAPVERLVATEDGAALLATAGDRLLTVDPSTGQTLADVERPGLAQAEDAGSGTAIVATPAAMDDPAAVAQELGDLLAGDAVAFEERLSAGADRITLGGLENADRDVMEDAIAAGELPGIELVQVDEVLVADGNGVAFLDRATGDELWNLPVAGGAHGLAKVTRIGDDKFYATAGTADDPTYVVIELGKNNDAPAPRISNTYPLPGLGSRIGYDEPTRQVHILGRTPDGTGSTVYVVEPHANAVYADARLPFDPKAWAFDVSEGRPSGDRQQLLAFAGDGSAATVEIGQHAFSWRVPGVIAGALMAGLLYLLARILFRRREVALLAGLFALVDGMLFAQSRIAMNDAYVGLFIIAAYTLFAAVWTGFWRGRWAFWASMPVIGVLLGLALASKWVAAYAIGALLLLILARSALGRILAIGGLIGLTAVLGYMAISVPEGATSAFGNVTFLLVMIGLTLVAVIASVLHPVAWSDEEFRLAVLGPAALGVVTFFGAVATGRISNEYQLGPLLVQPLEIAILLALGSVAVYGLFWLAGQYGFGPLARPPAPDDPARYLDPPAPAPSGWLRPGWLFGIPILWAGASLIALPIVVYVLSYLPWAAIGNHQIVPGWPPGHTGQTLLELTGQMYRYHNELTSAHAASSPWWAWPFDLKPVWFYQGGFGDGSAAAIYDAGNLVIWWFGVPAMAFVAWQAFKRRSLGLMLIAVGFAAQWIPWGRIDRAAFQYHYYTALPFVVLALAYFVAELWHGPSRRTWMLAKASAALAIVAPAMMHVLARPLCGFVDVTAVHDPSAACPPYIPNFVLTWRTGGLALGVGLGVLLFLLLLGSRYAMPRFMEGRSTRWWTTAAVVVVVLAAVPILILSAIPETPLLSLTNIPVEPIAFLVAIPLGYLAVQVLATRDVRRFVGGLVIAAVVTFILFYPNFSALPLPSTMVNSYQGLLPTYLYDFQFPVSTVNRSAPTNFATPVMGLLIFGLLVTCFVVGYSAWTWRITAVERRLYDEGPPDREAQAPAGSAG